MLLIALSDPGSRIDRFSLEPNFKVEHRAAGGIGIADTRHNFVSGYRGSYLFHDLRGMGVEAEIPPAVIDDDHIAVPFEIVGINDLPVIHSADLRTLRRGDGNPVADGIGIELRVFMPAETVDYLPLCRHCLAPV